MFICCKGVVSFAEEGIICQSLFDYLLLSDVIGIICNSLVDYLLLIFVSVVAIICRGAVPIVD